MWQALRVFASNRCDLPALVQSVAAMLRLVALRIERNSKAIPVFTYVAVAVCAACHMYTYQVSMVWFVLVRCREAGDVMAAIMGFTTCTTSGIGITKFLFMYIYRKRVQSMVAELLEFDKLPVAPAASGLLRARLRVVKRRAAVFGGVIMGNGIVYVTQPLFKPGRHLMDDGQVLYGLEPMLETPNYQIAMIIVIISAVFICYVVSNITALLIITTGYSEARLLALSQELMSLWGDAIQHYKENFDMDFNGDLKDRAASSELNKYVKYRLEYIIKCHATNVSLVQKVGYVFSHAIAVKFILLMVSLIADLLGGLENTFVILPFALMQVSMDCFTGQKLMDASVVFENAVYECQWENFDASNMKTVQVMLKISQKTLKLSAVGVVTLSFECLMSLVKTVYSAYTTLRSSMQ